MSSTAASLQPITQPAPCNCPACSILNTATCACPECAALNTTSACNCAECIQQQRAAVTHDPAHYCTCDPSTHTAITNTSTAVTSSSSSSILSSFVAGVEWIGSQLLVSGCNSQQLRRYSIGSLYISCVCVLLCTLIAVAHTNAVRSLHATAVCPRCRSTHCCASLCAVVHCICVVWLTLLLFCRHIP